MLPSPDVCGTGHLRRFRKLILNRSRANRPDSFCVSLLNVPAVRNLHPEGTAVPFRV